MDQTARGFALLLVALTMAPAGIPGVQGGELLPQDDAGSGHDAPDAFEDALPLAPGSYEGKVFAPTTVGLLVHAPDQHDWYRFDLLAPARVHATIDWLDAGTGAPHGGALALELASPGGATAGWTFVGDGLRHDEFDQLIDSPGAWRIHVMVADTGGHYRFSLASEPVGADLATHEGAGYLALGLRVGAGGGTARYSITLVSSFPDSTPHSQFLFVFRDGGPMLGGVGLVGFNLVDTSIEAAGAQASAAVVLEGDFGFGTVHWQGDLTEPGLYHLVAVATGAKGYAVFETTTTGEAGHGAPTDGGTASVLALERRAFHGTLSVSTGPASGSLDTRAGFQVDERLVGFYACDGGDCAARAPDGGVTHVHDDALWLAGGRPGPWMLTRELEAAVLSNGHVFLGCDCELGPA